MNKSDATNPNIKERATKELLRCPACLATPASEVLTDVQVLKIRCAYQALVEANHDYQRSAAAEELRAAFPAIFKGE